MTGLPRSGDAMTITNGFTRITETERRILIRYAAGDSPQQIAIDTRIPKGDIALTIDTLAKNNRGLARHLVKDYDTRVQAVVAAKGGPAPAQPTPPQVMARPVSPAAPPAPRVADLPLDPAPEPAPEPAPVVEAQSTLTRLDDIAQVLDAAAASGSAKLARAAEKIRTLAADLQAQVAEYQREAELRARVDQLAAELTAAREELRSLGRQPLTPPSQPAAAPATTVDAKAVRAWAAANGVHCPPRGRIPAAVLTGYEEAQR
jgi:hypothetical protein